MDYKNQNTVLQQETEIKWSGLTQINIYECIEMWGIIFEACFCVKSGIETECVKINRLDEDY